MRKNHIFVRSILSICVIVALAFSIPYAGVGLVSAEEEEGSAISEEYTPIYTVDDLYAINDNLAGKYILMNDIDMTEATAVDGLYDFNGNGWMPIGGGSTYAGGEFSGIFDGNNHSIKGMRIEISDWSAGYETEAYIGLFAKVSGSVKNLTMSSGNVTMQNCHDNNSEIEYAYYVGSICGYASYGSITNCINCNTIIVNMSSMYSGRGVCNESKYYAFYYIGGICGDTFKTEIMSCANIGDISVPISDCDYAIVSIGGLTAQVLDGDVLTSFNSGRIQCDMKNSKIFPYMGGIVGWLSDGCIVCCYNAGNILGSSTLDGCYVLSAGILASANNDSEFTDISYCYTLASDQPYSKGVIGAGTVSNCFYQKGNDAGQTGAVALSETQMKSKVRFTGFDFDNNWYFDPDSHYQYPQLIGNPHRTKTIEHIYDDGEVTTPANCTNTGSIKYTCTVCGATKNDTLPIDEDVHGEERKDSQSGDIYCSLCNTLLRKGSNETEISPVSVVIYGVNVTLNEAVGLNFYIGVPEIEDTYTATVTQRNDSYNIELTSDMIAEINGNNMYKVTCLLNAKEINDEVTIEIKNSKGNKTSFVSEAGKDYGTSYSLSVSSYLKSIDNKNDKTSALVSALLDYGNSAQKYFNYYPDSAEKVSDKVDAVTISQIDNSGCSITGKIDDFDYIGSSLVLESKVTIRHYFNISGVAIPEGYTFKVNGVVVSANTTNNACYVDISGIMPTQLDDTYTLEVYKDGVVVFTLVYGTEKYVYDTMRRSNNCNLVGLVKALHLYNVAANNYAS